MPEGLPGAVSTCLASRHTAASARNPSARYQVGKLGEFGSDWECEFILSEGSIYLGIYLDETKARAAAEYYELTGNLPPAQRPARPAPPEPDPEPPSALQRVAKWAGVIVVVWLSLALMLYLSGVEFR